MNTRLLFVAIISLLTNPNAFSQWVQTGGPYGTSRITSVFTNNSRIYATTSCGLHSTGSLTDKWDLKSTLQIETLIKKANVIYFGGVKTGIQRIDLSEPGFVSKSAGLDGITIIALKDEGTCLYAGIEGQGFSSSMGYTNDWKVANTGLPAEVRTYPPEQGGGTYYVRHVNCIEIIDNTLFCATHAGVYQANKETLMWSISGNGLPLENVQLLKVMEGILFAGVGNRLYGSPDKGISWNPIYETGSPISSVEQFNNYLFITTLGSGIYLSPDHGQTWSQRNEGLTDLNVTTLNLIDNTPVCGTLTKGIFYYNGTSWVNHSTGIICSDIRSLAVNDHAIAANDPHHVYIANDKTNSWNIISSSIDKNALGFIAAMNNTIFLSFTGPDDNQGIKYSTGNDAWQDLKTSIPFSGNDPYKMKINGNRLYVYEDGMMYYTDDLGATWGNLTLPAEYCNDIYDFTVYKNIPLAASCANGMLLRLTDNMQWSSMNNGLPENQVITSMAYSQNALYAYSYTNGVFVSKDEGQSWTKATNGFYTDWNIRSFASYKDNIFVTTVKGVYYTTDFGQNWIQMNEGLKNKNVGPLVIFNDTLFVGSRGNGVWKHDLSDFLPPKEDTTVKIQHIKLYPNPASEYVRFDFTDFDKAQIKLIDVLGRERINTKLGSDKQIQLDKLSSGTYIIIISTNQYVYTSKLIIKRKE